jgi:hypothetical protein
MKPLSENLPVVILACKVFSGLLEKYLPEELTGRITYLDYGLHEAPRKLKTALQEAIDSIEVPSLVVLGYGLCGNGLDGLKAGKNALLVPRADDCIALLLGSNQAYQEQFFSMPGTYWLSKGWLEVGSNPLNEYHEYIEKYGLAQADWLVDTQYKNYKRLAFVSHEPNDLETYRPLVREIAEFCARWDMIYEEILGSEEYIRRLCQACQDTSQLDDDFILVPPGGELKQGLFLRR